MKILIKTHPSTNSVIKSGKYGNHISGYHIFNHLRTWRKQGHTVNFIGLQNFVDASETYDVLFFRGFNSIRFEPEFGIQLLQNFKGKKILYLEGGDTDTDIGKYFDVVFTPETDATYNWWKKKYPNKDIRRIAWTCTELDIIDKDLNNPYPDDKFRCIYTGIYNDRMLGMFNEIAKDFNVVLGGIYYDGKVCRGLGELEVDKLQPNIQIINNRINPVCNRGLFEFGEQYPYHLYADVGLNLYAYNFEGALSSKLIDYLVCGLFVVTEETCPNRHRLEEINGGISVKWDDIKGLKEVLGTIKSRNVVKESIKQKARAIFSPDVVCEEILK